MLFVIIAVLAAAAEGFNVKSRFDHTQVIQASGDGAKKDPEKEQKDNEQKDLFESLAEKGLGDIAGKSMKRQATELQADVDADVEDVEEGTEEERPAGEANRLQGEVDDVEDEVEEETAWTPPKKAASDRGDFQKDATNWVSVHKDLSQWAHVHEDASKWQNIHRDTTGWEPLDQDTSQWTPVTDQETKWTSLNEGRKWEGLYQDNTHWKGLDSQEDTKWRNLRQGSSTKWASLDAKEAPRPMPALVDEGVTKWANVGDEDNLVLHPTSNEGKVVLGKTVRQQPAQVTHYSHMSEEMKMSLFRLAKKAQEMDLDSHGKAAQLKSDLDKNYPDGTWHVGVGAKFRAFVTANRNMWAHFKIGEDNFFLYQTPK